MRISKLHVDKKITSEKHLKPIDLTKKNFGSTVALVGKNGAGKSRVLELVEKYFKNLTIENVRNMHITNIPAMIDQQNSTSIERFKLSLLQNPESTPRGQQVRTQLLNAEKQLLTRLKHYGQAYIKVVDNDDLKNIKTAISTDSTLTFESILANSHFDKFVNNASLANASSEQLQSQGILLNEFSAFNSNSTLQYLTKLADTVLKDQVNLYFEQPNNLEFINGEIKKNTAYILFEKFQQYVKQFLGRKLTYRQKKDVSAFSSELFFNDQPFNVKHFSPGQKTLFAYAILFFYLDINSKTNIKDSIIIIDEPEKHLHPEAQISLLNAIQNITRESGQLWIATHSINILAHLDFTEILMVKDDEVIPPSRTTPGHSFNELMGIDNHINELTTFVNSISDWAYSNFMVQCFKNPDVIFSKNTNDPQFKRFKNFITETPAISLLDFGAGKGRFGYTLFEDDTLKNINYSAFEPNEEHRKLLQKIPNIKNVYHDPQLIESNSYNCVLLCNVLHEINPISWQETFSHIARILTPEGHLIIIEDKYLPRGESAHEFGYLILDFPEIKILFNLDDDAVLNPSMNDAAYDSRILFTALHKNQIRVNQESILGAIKALQNNTFTNIKALRGDKQDDVNTGRHYANQTQLFINSQLVLEYFKDKKGE